MLETLEMALVNQTLDYVNLSPLKPHWHLILATTSACFILQFLSPYLTALIIPQHYKTFSKKAKRDWGLHLVAFVHALYSVPAALYFVTSNKPGIKALKANPVLGFDDGVAAALAVSTGYFFWDTFVSIFYSQGPGFVLHGLSCLTVFLYSYKPMAQGFGPVFLLWEISSIFLNIHWCLDKLNLTGSRTQMVNGFFLVSTFFLVRIVGGCYATYWFVGSLHSKQVRSHVPTIVSLFYTATILLLDALNLYWIKAMIDALRKRFTSKPAEVMADGVTKTK